MKNYKYIVNNGLAFDEEILLKKLNKLAKEGWILREMTTFRYKLKKEAPQDLQYTVDYKNIDAENEEEYIEMMEASGWKLMCSNNGYYFFSSKPGTTEIYTDKECFLEKYKEVKDLFKKGIVYSMISLLLLIVINIFIPTEVKNSAFYFVYFIILGCSVGILVPSIMVTATYYFREKNILKKKFL